MSRSTPAQVIQFVVDPMRAIYSPPRDCPSIDVMVERFVSQLRGFAPEALESGWAAVERTYKARTWPALAFVYDACEKAQDRLKQPSSGNGDGKREHPWVVRERQAQDYALAFCKGPLGRQATAEYWLAPLEGYVRCAAYQQLKRGETPGVDVPQDKIEEWRRPFLAGVYQDLPQRIEAWRKTGRFSIATRRA